MVQPLISIIIPCYNRLTHLQVLLPKLLSEVHTNAEIIVSDDGSTDATAAYVQQYDAVQYIYNPNSGVSAARNKGAQIAKGEYLIFIDSDDWMLEKWWQAYETSINHYPNAVAHFAQYTEHGKIKGHKRGKQFFGNLAISVIPGSYCILKSVFNEIGGFDTNMTHSENWELMLRLTLFIRQHTLKSVLIKQSVLQYNSTYSRAKLIANKHNKIASYSALYHKHLPIGIYPKSTVAFFAHVVAINYAGIQDSKQMLVWLLKSVRLQPLVLKYYYKPLGIYCKRRLIAYPNTK